MTRFSGRAQDAARSLRAVFSDDSVTHHNGLDAGVVRVIITGLVFWSLVAAGIVCLTRLLLRSIA
jgi:hypothetical protein